LIDSTYGPALLVHLVGIAKNYFEGEVLKVGTKQGSQAGMEVGPACFVLCLLMVLAYQVDFVLTKGSLNWQSLYAISGRDIA
jgi:hypothetical protein